MSVDILRDMNTGNWCKLYGNIIYSTIWQEDPPTKCVWITMMAMADKDGYVGSSVPGLAKASGVSVEEAEVALEKFTGPDERSRTKDNDGRRIEEVAGGWRLLNFVAHRDGSEEQKERWRRQKAEQRAKARKEVVRLEYEKDKRNLKKSPAYQNGGKTPEIQEGNEEF